MTNEWQEFLDYITFPVYKADRKSDTSYLGRMLIDIFATFVGLGRILTIIARGYMFHNPDGSLNDGDSYGRVDHVRDSLLAWCSIPDEESGSRNPVDFRHLSARFPELVTEEEYSEFVRTEIVVNAVTHRDYGIKGTDIQIKMFDDRLEVDSPGTFAGMVKKDNIRYTHFSRNPKIAAFLKDYGYVKEYGEGVDRMCRELEAIGLPDPTFNNNTFILKTTIMSAAYEKLPFQAEKVADSTENPAVCGAESGDSSNYPAVRGAESGGSSNYPAVEMIALSEIINLCREYNYNNVTLENITRIYNEIEVNQIFSAAYVRKILDCADSTSRSLISKLKEMKVVVAVKGNGKGKYRFKYNNE